MTFNIKGFHTCKVEGSKEELQTKVPFLSGTKNQWLGQGYYFWTDVDIWAFEWGEDEKVISKFDITLQKDNLLDLVGSVADQLTLKKIIDAFAKGPLRDAYNKKFRADVSVSNIITWLREERDAGFKGVFPYWAVRAKDNRKKACVRFRERRPEELFLVERHQMCVYNEFKDQAVTFERFVHPEHFKDDVESGAVA